MSSVPRVEGMKAKRYKGKVESRRAIEEKIADLKKQLKDAESELAQAESDIKTMENNGKFPILIYMSTENVKAGGLCSLTTNRTHYIYYLLDLDTTIEYAWRGDHSDKHRKKGTCDLTNVIASNPYTRVEAIAEIKKAAADLINQHAPRTWPQLKKLLEEHFSKTSTN